LPEVSFSGFEATEMTNAHQVARTDTRAKILEAAGIETSNAAIARKIGCNRAYVGRVLKEAGLTCAEPDIEDTHLEHHQENDAAYLASLREHHPGGYPSLAIKAGPLKRAAAPHESNDINTRGEAAWPKSESRKVTLATSIGIFSSAKWSPSAAHPA
jgi:hypothetical protein